MPVILCFNCLIIGHTTKLCGKKGGSCGQISSEPNPEYQICCVYSDTVEHSGLNREYPEYGRQKQ